MSKGHVLVAAAIVAAATILAIVLSGSDPCADWHAQRQQAFTDALSGTGSHSAYDRVRSERPAGCA